MARSTFIYVSLAIVVAVIAAIISIQPVAASDTLPTPGSPSYKCFIQNYGRNDMLRCTNVKAKVSILLHCNSIRQHAQTRFTITGFHTKSNVHLRFDDEQPYDLQPVSTTYDGQDDKTHYNFYNRRGDMFVEHWNWLHDRLLVAMLHRHSISWQVGDRPSRKVHTIALRILDSIRSFINNESLAQTASVTVASAPAIRTYLETVTTSSCPQKYRDLRPYKP